MASSSVSVVVTTSHAFLLSVGTFNHCTMVMMSYILRNLGILESPSTGFHLTKTQLICTPLKLAPTSALLLPLRSCGASRFPRASSKVLALLPSVRIPSRLRTRLPRCERADVLALPHWYSTQRQPKSCSTSCFPLYSMRGFDGSGKFDV